MLSIVADGDEESVLTLKTQIGILKEFMSRFGGNRKLCALYARDIAYSFSRVYGAAMMLEHAKYSESAEDMDAFEQFVTGSMQSSFVSGDCGKCLVSQSLINLMNEKGSKDFSIRVQTVQLLGIGSY